MVLHLVVSRLIFRRFVALGTVCLLSNDHQGLGSHTHQRGARSVHGAVFARKSHVEHVQQNPYLAQRVQATSKIYIFEEDLNPILSYFMSDREFKTKCRVSCQIPAGGSSALYGP